jgi:GDP-4-dehydro-6-deoxy-D-mannose reductase
MPTSPTIVHLITGVTGFAGGWLASAIAEQGQGILGLGLQAVWPPHRQHLADSVRLISSNMADAAALHAILQSTQPRYIWHLAGFAAVGASFQQPEAAWAGNYHATKNLLDAVVRWQSTSATPVRILHVGSGLVYGPATAEAPEVDEESPLNPDSPYAKSKAAADLLCQQYAREQHLDLVIARPFNHIGPFQSPDFAIPAFAKQLVAIERGEQAPILETGDLSTMRDLTDVRDMVRAYRLLMKMGKPGEVYNIASGTTLVIQDVLDRMIALTGLRVELRQRADLLRPSEPAVLRVVPRKLHAHTQWAPQFSLDQTLLDTLDAARRFTPRREKVA